MLRWTSPETGDAIVDFVASMGAWASKKDERVIALYANYSKKVPTLNTLDEMMKALEFAEKEVSVLPGHPGEYLRANLKAFKTLTRCLAGDNISYKDAIRDILEVELRPVPKENSEKLAGQIEKILSDWGYKGKFNEMIAAWQEDKRIPPEQVVSTAKVFMERSRQKTLKEICPLPPDSIESINELRGVYFSGRSEYLGNYTGRLSFNVERPWNTPSFACVLTHEAYPGHHTYYTWWDYLFNEGKWPLEAAYMLINYPVNCLFEGVPEIGIRMLGWDDPTQDTPEISAQEKAEIIAARNIGDLRRMLQQNACYLYNVEKQSREDVIHYMTKDGWYSQIEASNTFTYFSMFYKNYYYPCYYYGRWILQQAYDLYPREKLPEFYRLVYDTPHTNSTLIKAVSEATGKAFNPFESI